MIMALNLLYHLYNFEKSPLKDELISYPSQPDVPAFTFSEYELNLLKDDPMNGIIYILKSKFSEIYIYIIYYSLKKWLLED